MTHIRFQQSIIHFLIPFHCSFSQRIVPPQTVGPGDSQLLGDLVPRGSTVSQSTKKLVFIWSPFVSWHCCYLILWSLKSVKGWKQNDRYLSFLDFVHEFVEWSEFVEGSVRCVPAPFIPPAPESTKLQENYGIRFDFFHLMLCNSSMASYCDNSFSNHPSRRYCKYATTRKFCTSPVSHQKEYLPRGHRSSCTPPCLALLPFPSSNIRSSAHLQGTPNSVSIFFHMSSRRRWYVSSSFSSILLSSVLTAFWVNRL